MRRVLLTCLMLCAAVCISAQDFVSLYRAEHPNDSNLTCITISPKMMGEILKSDTEKDEATTAIIRDLKSMQVLTSVVDAASYYADALEVVQKNKERFQPWLSFEDKAENLQIVVRKKDDDEIIELVMLMHEKETFAVINFTGNMNAGFISKLASSMKQRKHGDEN